MSRFSGIGLILGKVDGASVVGVDLDKCCDAVTGKFSAESREIVIGLDSYSEYSPSGDGAHILLLGKISAPIVKAIPGCKQIEIKGQKPDGHRFYFTFTTRHLSKTPHELMDRQQQLDALCKRVQAAAKPGMTVTIPEDEEVRFKKLFAGDMSDYGDDHSRADLALCCILARRHSCNAFLMDEQFQKSSLFREKWERSDYKWSTIWKAIQGVKGEPIFVREEETQEEDGETEYVVDPLPGQHKHAGWFPKGEVSLIGGSSGVGKTSWVMPLLESIRRGDGILGHTGKARDYRALLHDRSKKSMRRTAESLGLSNESIERVIRLSAGQQSRQPGEIVEAAIAEHPGAEVWLIEGLDLWITDMNKASVVASVLDGLQRVATKHNICVLATMGMPKQKGKDRYYGRDSLFGSAAMARKAETVVLLQLHDETDNNSVRRCDVLPRYSRAERFFFTWEDGRFKRTEEPEDVPEDSAMYRMERNVMTKYKSGEPVIYSAELGAETTFTRWRKQAVKDGKLVYSGGRYYRPPEAAKKPN